MSISFIYQLILFIHLLLLNILPYSWLGWYILLIFSSLPLFTILHFSFQFNDIIFPNFFLSFLIEVIVCNCIKLQKKKKEHWLYSVLKHIDIIVVMHFMFSLYIQGWMLMYRWKFLNELLELLWGIIDETHLKYIFLLCL